MEAELKMRVIWLGGQGSMEQFRFVRSNGAGPKHWSTTPYLAWVAWRAWTGTA